LAACCLVLLTAGSLQAPVFAQSDDEEIDDALQDAGVVSETEWESPQFGAVVTWGGDFTVLPDEASTYSDPENGMDALSLGTDTIYFGATYILTPDETPADYVERLIELRDDPDQVEDFELLDQGEDGDIAYVIYTGTQDGDTFVVASEVSYFDEDEGILQLVGVSAWAEEAEDAFDAVQDDVEVEGDKPFSVLDSDAVIVEDVSVDDAETPDVDDEETPVVDDEETPNVDDAETPKVDDEETPDAGDDAETPDASDDAETPNVDDDEGSGADLEALGIVGPRAYESPQFGGEVTWSRDWTVREDLLTSDTDALMDNVQLQDDDGNVFQVTLFVSQDETPAEYVDRLVEFRTDLESTEELDVIDQDEIDDRAYVLYATTVDGTEMYVLSEVVVYDEDEEVLMKVEMIVDPADAQDVFDLIQDDIEVDGDVPFLYDGEFPDPADL
jgi:hypothetical protein